MSYHQVTSVTKFYISYFENFKKYLKIITITAKMTFIEFIPEKKEQNKGEGETGDLKKTTKIMLKNKFENKFI